jgi:hypothetical protein
MSIGEVLQAIPGAAWGVTGVAMGVIGTLGATFLSNRSNDSRFDKQLLHDATQKAKDRAAELRRAVYLNASDQLIAVNAFMGGLASMDATDKSALTSGLINFMTATSRVGLVADENTRKKVGEISSTYGQMFFRLLAEASRAHSLQGLIKANRAVYKRLDREQVRLLAAMRDANENKESKFIFKSIWDSSEAVSKQLKDNADEYATLTDEQNALLVEYGRAAAVEMAAVTELQAEVSALLRQELDLGIDLEQMKKEFKGQSETAKNAAEVFYRKLEELKKQDNRN